MKRQISAIATLVLLASPLEAFAQNAQGNFYQPTDDVANIAQTSSLNNTVIQPNDKRLSVEAEAFRKRGTHYGCGRQTRPERPCRR
ncbi:hypothetical protein [Nostoc sp.]|uniref:hypothetical protein n=1 Tax=Nostoc sp. TaxID=1180 RepID=UPI002FF4F2CB